MKLTQGNKIALIVGFGVLIVGTILQIGIREWYAPDIRYEEGSYYTSGSTAMTSLKLKNCGHTDAEDIIIYAKFNTPLIEISTDNRALTFQNISGGKGQRYATGKISRLVPQQEIYIYFAIDNSSGPNELSQKFLAELTFKGGKGKPGRPVWIQVSLAILGVIVGSAIGGIFGYKYSEEMLHKGLDISIGLIKLVMESITSEKTTEVFESIRNKDPKDKTGAKIREILVMLLDLTKIQKKNNNASKRGS